MSTAKTYDCSGGPALSGTSWTPNVAGASATNHGSATVTSEVKTQTGPVTGYSQPAPASQELTFTINVPADLGAYGSLQLIADVKSVTGVSTVYPLLVYLSDPAGKEYVNLARAGTGGDCAQSGYFSSWSNPYAYPTQNSNCTVTWPSAFSDYYHWRERQMALPSVNTFPTCNWSGGTGGSSSSPACAFNDQSWISGAAGLAAGNYTAKYVMITSDKANAGTATATLELTVAQKTSTAAGGAVDLNVILVGNSVINASRTSQGQRNLNTAFAGAQSLYNTAGTNVKFGTIRVFEWTCETGGDIYASLRSSDLEQMFIDGGTAIGGAGNGKSINLYLVKSFSDNAGILGISGGIGGPFVNGKASSGVAVATFGKLSSWNPNCTLSSCPVSSQEAAYNDFIGTMAHEMGHYLGLNHPSESDGTRHDIVADTPICTATSSGYITIGSCLNSDNNYFPPTNKRCRDQCSTYSSVSGVFCPAVQECEFNHLMWWSSKNFKEGSGAGDGNMISSNAGRIINYSPLVQ